MWKIRLCACRIPSIHEVKAGNADTIGVKKNSTGGLNHGENHQTAMDAYPLGSRCGM